MKNKNTLLIGAIVGALLVFFIVKSIYMQPDYTDGEIAPSFEGVTTTGELFELNDLKGKYVLLDFWGTWCGPCWKQVPELKRMYNTFNKKQFQDATGFEIVSVAVEKNDRRWKNTIDKLNLNWPYHTLDIGTSLKFFNSPIADQYGVKEVPTTFLINPFGNIVGVNWTEEQIVDYLNERI